MKHLLNKLLSTLKALMYGQFSMAVTFWVWGIGVGVLASILVVLAHNYGTFSLFIISGLLKTVLSALTLAGVIRIFRRRETLSGVIALMIVGSHFLWGVVMIAFFLIKLFQWFNQFVA